MGHGFHNFSRCMGFMDIITMLLALPREFSLRVEKMIFGNLAFLCIFGPAHEVWYGH